MSIISNLGDYDVSYNSVYKDGDDSWAIETCRRSCLCMAKSSTDYAIFDVKIEQFEFSSLEIKNTI